MDSSVCCFYIFGWLLLPLLHWHAVCAAWLIYRRKCNKYRLSRLFEQCFSSRFSEDHGICMNFFGSKVKHACELRWMSVRAAKFIIAALHANSEDKFTIDVNTYLMCGETTHAMPTNWSLVFTLFGWRCRLNLRVHFSLNSKCKEFKLLRSRFKMCFFFLTWTFHQHFNSLPAYRRSEWHWSNSSWMSKNKCAHRAHISCSMEVENSNCVKIYLDRSSGSNHLARADRTEKTVWNVCHLLMKLYSMGFEIISLLHAERILASHFVWIARVSKVDKQTDIHENQFSLTALKYQR